MFKFAGLVVLANAHNVKNVVHVMMENRAFDTIFGYLTHTTDIDNLVGKEPFCNYVNVNDPNSLKVCTAPNQVDTSIYGPDHGYFETTNELYGTNDPSVPLPEVAPMNGFAQQAYNSAFKGADAAHLQQVMAGFDPKNIPVHATLASEFTIFDRWFAAIPGPTQPNRVSSHCATSKGWYNNDGTKLAEGNDCRSIFQDLSDAGLTWKNYFQEVPSFFFLRNTRLQMAANSKVWSSFVSDAQSGNLPNYSFLEPNFGELKQNQATYNGNLQLIVDGHAGEPGFFHNAEYFLKELYETLRNSPQWESTLLLITYDEHGGFFDHVPPPKAPNPDGITTPDPDHAGVVYSFDRLGVRVPVIAVSPWVAKGKVEHEPKGPHPDSQYSHASIPATIRSIFKLSSPPLTAREAWSGDFESILMDTPRDDCPYVMPAVNMNGF
ncbi:hypothetical protein HK103_006696 [Boothiomyces macroporosus]|uniref:Phosphoesterase n=1 Tax=Boothiomyces macroporosus TaxID=261099 RepID=A0AAD5Y6W1_9FUNG|nr:hypothetical protein HK103_006696 [Boothiomyces macroporosus]